MTYMLGVYPTPTPEEPPALTITTTSVPSGTINEVYQTTTFQAAGGVPPYSWGLVAPYNTPPAGMSFSGTGVLSGTPTASGTVQIQAEVVDSTLTNAVTGIINLVIAEAPTGAIEITTVSLPNVTRGQEYSAQLTVINQVNPVTWSYTGTLPTGISLNTSTGALTGTPTVAGVSNLTFTVVDSVGSADSGELVITVNQVANPVITNGETLPTMEVSEPFSRPLNVNGGWPPFSFTLDSGSMPAGSPAFAVNASTGEITGTPTTVSSGSFVVRVTDSEARTSTRVFNWNVVAEGTVAGPNEYFDALAASPYVHLTPASTVEPKLAYSFRSQSQLNQICEGGAAYTIPRVQYDPLNDDYAGIKQDACRLWFPPDAGKAALGSKYIPNINGAKFNSLNTSNCDTVLLIWDRYFTPEWRDNQGGGSHIKATGINTPWLTLMESPGPAVNSPVPNDSCVHYSIFTDHGNVGGDLSTPELQAELAANDGWRLPVGMVEVDGIHPAGPGTLSQNDYQLTAKMYENQWIRYIIEVKLEREASEFTEWNEHIRSFHGNPSLTLLPNPMNGSGGFWRMFSSWFVYEDGTIQRTAFRIPCGWGRYKVEQNWIVKPNVIGAIRWTMDTSKVGPATGTGMYSYLRNFVVLVDYPLPAVEPESDTFIFQAPIPAPVS